MTENETIADKKKRIEEKLRQTKETKDPRDFPYNELQRDNPPIQSKESIDRILEKLKKSRE